MGSTSIFAVRKNSQVFIYLNSCPHLGVPLEWQPDRFLGVDGELIQCSTHGALFTIHEGLCVSGPCSGQHLAPIACELRADEVWANINH